MLVPAVLAAARALPCPARRAGTPLPHVPGSAGRRGVVRPRDDIARAPTADARTSRCRDDSATLLAATRRVGYHGRCPGPTGRSRDGAQPAEGSEGATGPR